MPTICLYSWNDIDYKCQAPEIPPSLGFLCVNLNSNTFTLIFILEYLTTEHLNLWRPQILSSTVPSHFPAWLRSVHLKQRSLFVGGWLNRWHFKTLKKNGIQMGVKNQDRKKETGTACSLPPLPLQHSNRDCAHSPSCLKPK